MWVVRLIGSIHIPSGRAAFDPLVCYWFAKLKCFVGGTATYPQSIVIRTGSKESIEESIVTDVGMLVGEVKSMPSCMWRLRKLLQEYGVELSVVNLDSITSTVSFKHCRGNASMPAMGDQCKLVRC